MSEGKLVLAKSFVLYLISSGLMKLTPISLNLATVPDIKSSSLLTKGFFGFGTAARSPLSGCRRSSLGRGRRLLARWS